MSQSLTQLAHELARNFIRAGDIVVDATAGNGHDTAFLANIVGEKGRVYAFDIQQNAIEATRQRLDKAGLLKNVSLVLDGHENMAHHIPTELNGTIAAVFFNLGYLPHGDHSIITRETTTLAALEQSAAILRHGGHLSILVYPGHPGGMKEAGVVRDWIQSQNDTGSFSFTHHGDPSQAIRPWLVIGSKKP
ncbi:MAG: class I SAM-dependent methyltransferase, partial [Puniceicoccales bacterium]|nr:class I SAM-dependent methyltransferase [Puniceicoccales bacterium]